MNRTPTTEVGGESVPTLPLGPPHMHQRRQMLVMGKKSSIGDASIPQPGKIVFSIMRYGSGETVQRSGYFQSSVSYIKVQIMFK